MWPKIQVLQYYRVEWASLLPLTLSLSLLWNISQAREKGDEKRREPFSLLTHPASIPHSRAHKRYTVRTVDGIIYPQTKRGKLAESFIPSTARVVVQYSYVFFK